MLRNLLAGLFVFAQCLLPFCTAAIAAERGAIMSVGPQRPVKTLVQAAKLARDGQIIEVDAGDYVGDVAVWEQRDLTLRAVGGRARLLADGKSAEDKGIWVIRGGRIRIKGFDFVGAAVSEGNGAGIRLERGDVLIDDCRFLNNENGILTAGHAQTRLEIVNSEFGFNGAGDGYTHNLYVGSIGELKVSGSYFHHAKSGHLLKSRADRNLIFFNRLTDEAGGTASYELEFPNGGVAYVVGNILQQSATTENPTIVAFGMEGYRASSNRLYLINNTLVDLRAQGGVFLKAKPGAEMVAINNILVGAGILDSAGAGVFRNNFTVQPDEFVSIARGDFHLRPKAKLRGKAIAVEIIDDIDMNPAMEYSHPRSVRPLDGWIRSPGAQQ